MLTTARYTLACRNFLTYVARARPAARTRFLYDREDARGLLDSFTVAAEQLSLPLEPREVPSRAAGLDLLAALREATADLTEGDSLVLLLGNNLCVRLMQVPEVGDIHALLAFCDSLSGAATGARIDPIAEEAFVRMHAIDFEELRSYNARLRDALEGATAIRVTCASGTDLTLTPRHWVGEETAFEVYTAPLEDSAAGRIVYCSLENPYLPALIASVSGGRVTSLFPASGAGEVTESLRLALERGAPELRVVAELGIGTNPGAALVNSFPGQMENETIRGTCHFDLGENRWFGGANQCAQHIGGIVWRPTISTERGPVVTGTDLAT